MNVYRYQQMLSGIDERAKGYARKLIEIASPEAVMVIADHGQLLQSCQRVSHVDQVSFFRAFCKVNSHLPGYIADIEILSSVNHELVDQMEDQIAIHVATLTRAGAA
jgi:hypothetical protein